MGYYKGERGTGQSDGEHSIVSEKNVEAMKSRKSEAPELLGFLKQKDE